MVIATDFPALRAWADALASILLIELSVLLLIITALMFILFMAARWFQMHVIPLLNTTIPAARQALDATNSGTDRVVRGVAEVYGLRRAAETAVQIMLFGREATRPGAHARGAAGAPMAPPERPAAQGTRAASEPPTAPSSTLRPSPPPAGQPAPSRHDLDDMAANAG